MIVPKGYSQEQFALEQSTMACLSLCLGASGIEL